MIVSITQYRRLATDANGHVMPLGADRIGCQVRTADGAFTALDAQAKFVRVATDVAVHMNPSGGASTAAHELLLPGVEYFAVKGGEALSIMAVPVEPAP